MQTWTKTSIDDVILDFLWSQWAQLGVAGLTQRVDRWAIDPEALLRFTLLFAPRNPRLFDEVLDWLRVNGRLISVKRLRNLAQGERERRLIKAALAWAGTREPGLQLWAQGQPEAVTPEPLADLLVRDPDEALAAWGFLWPNTPGSNKSVRVDPLRPVALAFRLRLLIGVGARAEIIRYLLTNQLNASTSEIARAAGFGRRNVAEALGELAEARVIDTGPNTRRHTYSLDVQRWGTLLMLRRDDVPFYVDWIRLFAALWRIAEWFDQDAHSDRSEYMRASEARQLVLSVESDLIAAGLKLPPQRGTPGTEYWKTFQETIEATLDALRAPPTQATDA
jgi:hypothetical protein